MKAYGLAGVSDCLRGRGWDSPRPLLGTSSAAGGPSGGPRRYAGQALAGAQGQTRPEVAQTPAAGREPTARMWPRAGSAQVKPADPLHRTWALSDF